MRKATTYVLAGLCLLLLGMVIPSRVRTQEYSSPVREVEKPARSPFFFRCHLNIFAGDFLKSCNFTWPAGQRLVIENIRGRVSVPSGQTFVIQFQGSAMAGTASGSVNSSDFDLPASFESTFGAGGPGTVPSDRYAINQLTRIYLDASPTGAFGGNLFFSRVNAISPAEVFLEVNGYLIAVP